MKAFDNLAESEDLYKKHETRKLEKNQAILMIEALCKIHNVENVPRIIKDLQDCGFNFEKELEDYTKSMAEGKDLISRAAHQLLKCGGKRLRPMVLALIAGRNPSSRKAVDSLATAIELIHSATLLHDDVMDLGEIRRKEPTSRMLYGNNASILAGDQLLVDAIRAYSIYKPELLEDTLKTIESMIHAEALQLENSKKFPWSRQLHQSICEGKTASLFALACKTGASLGAYNEEEIELFHEFGTELGVAFQIMDDVLDLTGDFTSLGKKLFADLGDGKMTLPLILTWESYPELKDSLVKILVADEDDDFAETAFTIRSLVSKSGAGERCYEAARARIDRCQEILNQMPKDSLIETLSVIASLTLERKG